MISEFAREHVAGSAAITVCSSHVCCCLASSLIMKRSLKSKISFLFGCVDLYGKNVGTARKYFISILSTEIASNKANLTFAAELEQISLRFQHFYHIKALFNSRKLVKSLLYMRLKLKYNEKGRT